MFFELRPVGNRIKLKASPFNVRLFGAYTFIGFDSGTSALGEALTAIREQNQHIMNPEVILPAYTCPDIISACLYAKVKPILVDFEENTSWMDLTDLQVKISESCIAVIAINFLGIPERVNRIRETIKLKEVVIVEDSAQGIPKEHAEKYWFGDLVVTSFGRGKPLNLLGGGAIFLNPEMGNKVLGERLRIRYEQLKSDRPNLVNQTLYKIKVILFGIISTSFFYYFLTKLPYLNLGETRFHPLNSIKKLPCFIKEQINVNYQKYVNIQSLRNAFDDIFAQLSPNKFISLPTYTNLPISNPLLRYPVLILDKTIKEEIYNKLQEKGLGVSKMYKETLPNISGVEKSMLGSMQPCPNAEELASNLITLPIHDGINKTHVEKIKNVFLEYI